MDIEKIKAAREVLQAVLKIKHEGRAKLAYVLLGSYNPRKVITLWQAMCIETRAPLPIYIRAGLNCKNDDDIPAVVVSRMLSLEEQEQYPKTAPKSFLEALADAQMVWVNGKEVF